MKKLEKKVEALLESLKKDQSAMVMCSNDDGEFFYESVGNEYSIAAGICTILSDYFDDDNQQAKVFARGMIMALHTLVEERGKAGLAIASTVALATASKSPLAKSLVTIIESLSKAHSDDDDDEEEENCDECDANKVCPLPKAIKYRKENHIPAPRNRKNKRNASEEKGN